MIRVATLIIAGAAVFGALNAAADVEAGKAAYAVCATCHGQQGEGNVALNAPRLAGQEDWYLSRQLTAYKVGRRGTARGDIYGLQMRPMAMTVAGAEAEANLIEYIGMLPAGPAPVTIEGDATAGQQKYAVCVACHGARGEGVQALGGPRLAGQDDWYLVRQLQNYKNGLRAYSRADTFGQQMKPMAMTLTDDKSINDVVAYINTLR